MTEIRRTVPALVALCLLAPPAARTAEAEPPERLTVEDAVRIALDNHPTLRASQAARRAAGARVRQSWAPFLPSFSGSLSYQPQTANFAATPSFGRIFASGASSLSVGVDCDPQDPTCAARAGVCVITPENQGKTCFTTSARPTGNSFQLFNFFTAQIGINATLFDFGRTWFGFQAAKENEAASGQAVAAVALQVALDAKGAFYGSLATDGFVAVAMDSVATQQRHVDQMQGFVEVGTRTRVDLAQAHADLAAAQLSLARAHGNHEGALALLHAALGLEEWHPLQLVEPPPPDVDALERTFGGGDLVEDAVQSRPEPKQLMAQARAARAQEKSIRGTWFPSLTFGIGGTFAGDPQAGLTPNFQIGVGLAYPGLGLNPVLVDGQLREARANQAVASEQARATRNGIRLETSQALAALHSAREAVVAAQALEAAATERRELANGRFQAGLGTVLELSDAELVYVNARAQRIQAQFDLWVAKARLDKALGR